MSNFNCPTCGMGITEDENGYYITGCKHYSIEKIKKKKTTIEILIEILKESKNDV